MSKPITTHPLCWPEGLSQHRRHVLPAYDLADRYAALLDHERADNARLRRRAG